MKKDRYDHPDNKKFRRIANQSNVSFDDLLPFASQHVKDKTKEKMPDTIQDKIPEIGKA